MSRTYRDNSYHSLYERSEITKIKRHERSIERNFCKRLINDMDYFDSVVIEEKPKIYGHNWYPYWAPMNRWLNNHIGQSWNLVYSKLLAKLRSNLYRDDRCLREMISFHVEVSNNPKYSYYISVDGISYREWDFFVDDNGLLQKRQFVSRKKTYAKRVSCDTDKIAEWLDGRVVGKRDNKLYWFINCSKGKKLGRYRSSSIWKCEWGSNNGRYGLYYKFLSTKPIYRDGEIVEYVPVWEVPFHFRNSYSCYVRQDKEFSDKDVEMWNTIPEQYQTAILKWSPLNPKPDLKDLW